jgi:hypothetical protein
MSAKLSLMKLKVSPFGLSGANDVSNIADDKINKYLTMM